MRIASPSRTASPRSRIASALVLALAFPVAWSLHACDSEGRVAGASTETTNGLTGTVSTGDGHPVAGATVTVWDSRGETVLARATTDLSGRWGADVRQSVVGIQAYARDSASGAWLGGERIVSDTHRVALRLSPTTGFALRGIGFARLAGTPWRTTTGTFRRIPSGGFTVLSDTAAGAPPVASIRVAPDAPDTFEVRRDSGLLVEDFDDGDSTWIFGPVRDNSARWFTQTSPRGAALLAPLAAESTATPGIQTEGAWKGRSLHIRYFSADTGYFVQAGIYFRGFLDLSELRGIRVRAKGDGVLRFGLSGYGPGSGRAVWEASPDSVWRQYEFRPGEEIPVGGGDPPRAWFSDVSHAVFLLMIQAYGGSELWIDDIRFDGITPETCLPE